jgi:hypothetical protein
LKKKLSRSGTEVPNGTDAHVKIMRVGRLWKKGQLRLEKFMDISRMHRAMKTARIVKELVLDPVLDNEKFRTYLNGLMKM